MNAVQENFIIFSEYLLYNGVLSGFLPQMFDNESHAFLNFKVLCFSVDEVL